MSVRSSVSVKASSCGKRMATRGGQRWDLGGLGFMLSWSNYFIEAREELSKSIEIFERYGHVCELIFLHNRLSDSCRFKGDMDAARVHAERVLALAEQSGHRKGQADALRNLSALVYTTEAGRHRAEMLNYEALTLLSRRRCPDRDGELHRRERET